MAAIQVTGETQLAADLRGMARAALQLEPVLSKQARRAAEGVTNVADRTGKLERDIKAPRNREVTRSGFDIGVGNFYGHMVFGGTSHSRAQPPKVPTNIARETARELGDYIVRHRHGVA